MKKIILLFISIFCLSSCSINTNKNTRTEVIDNNGFITIKYDDLNFEYRKTKIDNHDFYIRVWQTKYGYGSDLVHNPNCSYCK